MRFDRTLVRIRERSFPDLLDLAVVVTRHRFRVIAPAAIAGIAPFALLNAWIASHPNSELLLLWLIPLEAPWATAPITLVMAGLMFGENISPWRIALRILKALPTLLFYQFFLRGIFVFVFILSPLIPARMAFMNEVILLERDRWYKGFKRVGTLCERRGGDLFGQFLSLSLASAVFIGCFYAGSGTILTVLFDVESTWDLAESSDLAGWRVQVPLWISIAFAAVVRFFSYIDQRIRIEGWEVELRLKLAGQAIEEAQRW